MTAHLNFNLKLVGEVTIHQLDSDDFLQQVANDKTASANLFGFDLQSGADDLNVHASIQNSIIHSISLFTYRTIVTAALKNRRKGL